MAKRRGFWDSFSQGYALGDRMVKDWDAAEEKRGVADAWEKGSTPEETPQYAPADEFDTGGYVTGTQYGLRGKVQDKPFTEGERHAGGLGAVADYYKKSGKMDKYLDFSDRRRRAEKDELDLSLQRDESAVREKYKTMGPVELFNSDTGLFGSGEHKGRDAEIVDMGNGKTRLTFYERGKGNVVGYKDFDTDKVPQLTEGVKQRAMLAELAAINPRQYLGQALQLGVTEKQIEELAKHREQAQKNFETTHDFNVTKHGDELTEREKDRVLRERGLRIQEAQVGQGKKQLVPVYDKETGEQRMVMVDTGALKSGDVLQTPGGTTLNKPTDKTDDRMKQVATEYKQTTDELDYLQKNIRDGEWFSFGKDDPKNQDIARIKHLRDKAQALNDQMTALRMAQYLPKNAAEPKPAPQQGIPAKYTGASPNNPEPAAVSAMRANAATRADLEKDIETIEKLSRGMGAERKQDFLQQRGYFDLKQKLAELGVR